MSAIFDYWAPIKSAYQIGNETWRYWSDTYTYPTNVVFFQSLFNPGHNGVTSYLEWELYDFRFVTTGGMVKWSLQYREVNGVWTDFKVSAGQPGDDTHRDGIITTPITLPIEIRLLATGTKECYLYLETTSYFYMRAVGSVSSVGTDFLFDHVGALRNAVQLHSDNYTHWDYLSEYIEDPVDHVYFQSLLNPGYVNTTTFLEWTGYNIIFGSGTITSWKVQAKEVGGDWITIDDRTGEMPLMWSGRYNYPHQVTLPLEIRIIATGTGTFYMYFEETSRFFMRAAGTAIPGPTGTTTTTTSTCSTTSSTASTVSTTQSTASTTTTFSSTSTTTTYPYLSCVVSPLVSGDDGYWTPSGSLFNNTNAWVYLGYISDGTEDDHSEQHTNCFFRFPSITIPQGSTIYHAFIRLRVGVQLWDGSFNVYFNNIDDAVAPTDIASGSALVRTINHATLHTSIQEVYPYSHYTIRQTGELAAAVQEVIDRPGWVSGNAMIALVASLFTRYYSTAETVNGSIFVPELYIYYL